MRCLSRELQRRLVGLLGIAPAPSVASRLANGAPISTSGLTNQVYLPLTSIAAPPPDHEFHDELCRHLSNFNRFTLTTVGAAAPQLAPMFTAAASLPLRWFGASASGPAIQIVSPNN